ncbi:MAG: hypothetical protein VB067_12915 [Christensenellaceae bacterium]|nr:hypothetical protein [Christensenellaceae bacterium]MEA5065867.1 hypothetical protein [Eubacteriales bacterium]MEA5069889.1 hypothetical protein [Christensenellaceae bacterium]
MGDGWIKGIAWGALAGVSAWAVASMMDQRTRRQVVKAVAGATDKVMGKAEQIMK